MVLYNGANMIMTTHLNLEKSLIRDIRIKRHNLLKKLVLQESELNNCLKNCAGRCHLFQCKPMNYERNAGISSRASKLKLFKKFSITNNNNLLC